MVQEKLGKFDIKKYVYFIEEVPAKKCHKVYHTAKNEGGKERERESVCVCACPVKTTGRRKLEVESGRR